MITGRLIEGDLLGGPGRPEPPAPQVHLKSAARTISHSVTHLDASAPYTRAHRVTRHTHLAPITCVPRAGPHTIANQESPKARKMYVYSRISRIHTLATTAPIGAAAHRAQSRRGAGDGSRADAAVVEM